MEDTETPRIHKYGDTKNNSNYYGNCTSRDFQFGTWKISGRLIFVEQRVQGVTPQTTLTQTFTTVRISNLTVYGAFKDMNQF
jgi:hypothetical protein